MKYEYERDKDMVNAHLEEARAGTPTTVEVVKKLSQGTKAERLEVTFARRVETPIRAESPARAHWFQSLDGFIKYVAQRGTQPVVLADAVTGAMAAVLDESAADGFEIVRFSPCLHPLYSPWQQRYGTAMGMKDLARFVIQNCGIVREPAPSSLMARLKQIQVSKHVTVYEGMGNRSLKGVVCTTKIQGKEENEVAELPEVLVLECPMFVGSPALKIEVDLLLEVADDSGQVQATLTSADADYKRVLAIQAMLNEVSASLPEAIVSLGRLNYQDWNYLPSDAPHQTRNVPKVDGLGVAAGGVGIATTGGVVTYVERR
jgi:hypothetical protein